METAFKYFCVISCVVVVLCASAWADTPTYSLKLAGYLPNSYSTCRQDVGIGTGSPCTTNADCTTPGEACRRLFRDISCPSADAAGDAVCAAATGGPSQCVQTVFIPPNITGLRCSPVDPVPIGMVQNEDTIFVDVFLEKWDLTPDIGICENGLESCNLSQDNCPRKFCENSHRPCTSSGNCAPYEACVEDTCLIYPRIGAFQWAMNAEDYANDHGPESVLSPAEIPCTDDLDCKHGYIDLAQPKYCTCTIATCDGGICSDDTLVYIASIRGDYLYRQFDPTDGCSYLNYDFQCGGTVVPPAAAEEEGLSKYVGTVMLDVPEYACGRFELGLDNRPSLTFVNDAQGISLPRPIIDKLSIQLSPNPICPGGFPPCNDGNLCTHDICACPDEDHLMAWCYNPPVECIPPEECNPATGRCWLPPPPDCPEITLDFGDPMTDPGQPHPIDDAGTRQGYQTFEALGPAGGDELACWSLAETDAGGCGNAVTNVAHSGGTYTIMLGQPLQPGAVTEITYESDDGLLSTGTYTALPGDVNGDDETNLGDLSALITCLNTNTCATWQCDIDRLGSCAGADLERLVDLLNGAGEYLIWDGVTPAADWCTP